jgi:hypothetical protein
VQRPLKRRTFLDTTKVDPAHPSPCKDAAAHWRGCNKLSTAFHLLSYLLLLLSCSQIARLHRSTPAPRLPPVPIIDGQASSENRRQLRHCRQVRSDQCQTYGVDRPLTARTCALTSKGTCGCRPVSPGRCCTAAGIRESAVFTTGRGVTPQQLNPTTGARDSLEPVETAFQRSWRGKSARPGSCREYCSPAESDRVGPVGFILCDLCIESIAWLTSLREPELWALQASRQAF